MLVQDIDPERETRLKCGAAGRAIIDAQGLLSRAKSKLATARAAARGTTREAMAGLVSATAFLESAREALEEAYEAVDEHGAR